MQNRKTIAEQALLDDALQAANKTLMLRKAELEAQDIRVQAELDRYLERSMLWQQAKPTDAWPEIQYGYVAPYAQTESWPSEIPQRYSAPSRVNWAAIIAVGGTLTVLPFLIPAIVSAIAPAVSVVASAAVYILSAIAGLLAFRAAFSEARKEESPERPRRKITVTVEVED